MSWNRNQWTENIDKSMQVSSEKPRHASSRTRLGVYGIVALCAFSFTVIFFVFNSNQGRSNPTQHVKQESTQKQIPLQRKEPRPVPARVVSNVNTNQSAVVPSTQDSLTPEKTPEELLAEVRAKDPLYDRHHIVAAKPLVAGGTDQLIVTIFSTDLGDMPPFIPPLSNLNEEETIKAIDKLEKTADDDTPEAREAKEIVNAVKERLKKFLEDGGTVNGFLSHYANELQSAFEERQTCKELVSKSIRSESPQFARELYEKYNKHLSQKGIKPLTLNRKQKEYLGITEDE